MHTPPCPCDQDFETLFDAREANHDLEQWRRHGLPAATADLIAAIQAEGAEGARLLDIGAGVGMVHLELLAAGAASAVDVDASSAYLAAARDQAERRGLADRVEHLFGDVVALAAELPPTDIVTLDRVICCYPDLPALLAAALRTAPRLVGFVLPTDAWWNRGAMAVFNAVGRLLRRHHFFYVHRHAEITRLMAASGFVERRRAGRRYWQVAVYARSAG